MIKHQPPPALFLPVLTGEEDQEGAEEKVHRLLPAVRHASHRRRDEDLGGDVELQGEGDEDAEAVQQLDGLVQPGDSRRPPHGREPQAQQCKGRNKTIDGITITRLSSGIKFLLCF